MVNNLAPTVGDQTQKNDMMTIGQTSGSKKVATKEPQQLVPASNPMNDDRGSPGDQIDESSATPLPPRDPDYAYIDFSREDTSNLSYPHHDTLVISL